MPPAPPTAAGETALLFPTGGYVWPGMGADLDPALLTAAEDALGSFGVPAGALRRLMDGAGQAGRARQDHGWVWSGDFPLSMVAQTVLGVGLAAGFVARHGAPRVLLGESMGELPAYCAAGVLDLADAVQLTFRWARDLAAASTALDLRMAVVEGLDEDELDDLPPRLGASPVVIDAPRLVVVALPRPRLDELDAEVRARGGHILVSNNPCAAHEPRLANAAGIWGEHARFLAGLRFAPPTLPLLSTLDPGRPLDTPAALARNRVETTFTHVRWGETVAGLPELGVRRALQLGPPSSAYGLRRLRAEDPRVAGLRVAVAGTLAQL